MPVAKSPGIEFTELAGRYKVSQLIGAGGMASVYLARDLRYDRDVAVKVLRRELATGIAAERFLQEIRITARLSHPNIPPLYDSGEVNGLLYYVMPVAVGESLRDVMRRRGRLPLEYVKVITDQIASALSYAHAQGVVHRDVKPENILLPTPDHVWLADFGLLHAVQAAAQLDLTGAGFMVGSPRYMSPEQAVGETDVDGRSDIYSLACVCFEMLSGTPAFDGASVPEILSRHLTSPPPDLRRIRADVSPRLAQAIQRGMAKDPTHRFETADEFVGALFGTTSKRNRWFVSQRTIIGAGIAALLVVTAVVGVTQLLGGARPNGSDLRIAVLPFQMAPGTQGIAADQLMFNALERWQGVELVGLTEIAAVVERAGSQPLSTDQSRGMARRLDAGRFISGDISGSPQRHRISAVLHSAASAVPLARARLYASAAELESAFAALADSLLAQSAGITVPDAQPARTRNLPAWITYAKGREAIEDWELKDADSLFTVSLNHDPTYTDAALWLAQVRAWADQPLARWHRLLNVVERNPTGGSDRDAALARGLRALADGARPVACTIYDSLTVTQPRDFIGWFNLARCRAQDQLVISDADSPSGYAFRSSYARALVAYKRAFDLLPSIHKLFRDDALANLERIFFASKEHLRPGHDQAGTIFLARPEWQGDSLAFVPWPTAMVNTGARAQITPAAVEALRHQRELLLTIVTGWASVFPDRPEVIEANAVARDLLSDAGAVELMRRARALTSDSVRNRALAGSTALLLIKYSLPDNLPGLRAAAALADTVLSVPQPGPAGIGLAIIRGRPELAAGLARVSPKPLPGISVPPNLLESSEALLAFAAYGSPVDSIRRLESHILRLIDAHITPAQRDVVRESLLMRPSILGFPEYRSSYSFRYWIAALQSAVLTRNSTRADSILARHTVPADPSNLDFVTPFVLALEHYRDYARAVALLDECFRRFDEVRTAKLMDPALAGALVRAVRLYPSLLTSVNRPSDAATWRQAGLALFGPFPRN